MVFIKMSIIVIALICSSSCSSKTNESIYQSAVTTSTRPFVVASVRRNANFEGQIPKDDIHGNGMGINPFEGMTNGYGGSTFSTAVGTLNGGGKNGNGMDPFSAAMLGKVSSPFKANMDSSGGVSSIGLTSLINHGPGSLTDGSFLSKKSCKVMEHDTSIDLKNNCGQFGEMSPPKGENKIGMDNSRFDTSAYQKMLLQLFSTDNAGKDLKGMGTPYNYNEHGTYNTATISSVLPFALTNKQSFVGKSDSPSVKPSNFHDMLQTENQYTESESFSEGSLMSGNHLNWKNYNIGSVSKNSDEVKGSDSITNEKKNPFYVNHYNMKESPFSTKIYYKDAESTSINGYELEQGLFDISPFGNFNPQTLNGQISIDANYNTATKQFSANGNYNDIRSTSGDVIGTGQTPFDTSNFGNLNKQPGSGQNTYDTTKYQASVAQNDLVMGNRKYQNIGTGNLNNNNRLEEYGYAHLGTLSGLSGNQMKPSGVGELGMASFLQKAGPFTAKSQASSSYTGLQGKGNENYGVDYTGASLTYGDTGSGYYEQSKNQFETPFEADNYNDLIGNPFKSNSYFDTTKQNFKLPYEITSNIQQSSYSNSGQSTGYGGNSNSGPAGDPFHQGGNSRTSFTTRVK